MTDSVDTATGTPRDAITTWLTNHYSKSFYGNPGDALIADQVLAALDAGGFAIVARADVATVVREPTLPADQRDEATHAHALERLAAALETR